MVLWSWGLPKTGQVFPENRSVLGSVVIPKGYDGCTDQVPPGKKGAPKAWGTPTTDKHGKL